MRFTSDSQRRAMFANMSSNVFSGRSKSGLMVKNRFSEKEAEFKEGLNGFVCPKCGAVVDEGGIGSHSCSDSTIESEVVSSVAPTTERTSTVIEDHIIDDDGFDEFEEDDDDLFG